VTAAVVERSRPRWYARWQGLVLAAGALAGSVAAVVGLWDRVFPEDVEDYATITSASVTSRTSLTAFVRTLPDGGRVPLRPAGDSLGTLRTAGVVVTPSEQPSELSPGTVEPSSEPTTPSESGTADPPDVTPSDHATDGRARATGVPTDGSVVKDTVAPADADDYEDQVVSQPELTKYPPPALAHVMGGGLSDEDGDPLSPQEAAKRLAKALDKVEATHDRKHRNPLGWVVAVNLDISGLDGEPLLLTWSLDGLDVPLTWRSDTVAYRLMPTTDHDGGSVEVWVPDLKRPGAYLVNLELARGSDGVVLYRATPVPLPEDKAQNRPRRR
jgi:hypothetical protein